MCGHQLSFSVCVKVLKLLAEMSPFCGDMEKLEANLNMLFTKLVVSTSVHVVVWQRKTHAYNVYISYVFHLHLIIMNYSIKYS